MVKIELYTYESDYRHILDTSIHIMEKKFQNH